ncbi:MAG: DUF5674 family protein [Patescibacteria group bacterium]
MKIIDHKNKIIRRELQKMTSKMFGNLVKAVVDIEKEIIAVDAELHSDEEASLLEKGSEQKNLWGINLYPDKRGKDFIEFDSMINIRPSQGNRSRGVDDSKIQKSIVKIINKLIVK